MMTIRGFYGAVLITAVLVPAARASNGDLAIQMLQTAVGEHSKKTVRHGSVLGHLRNALRALDEESQKNNAVRKAHEITKARQLASPPTSAKVRDAIGKARVIVGAAENSPMTADLAAIRDRLREESIEDVREVVADDVDAIASLSKRISQLSLQLTEALTSSSAALVGRRNAE